jgi:AcrR family transcriptional regulator
MPKRDDEYMAARRDQILDAATACLLRSGLDGLSTSAICKEAGISIGALYTHFARKADILLALAQRNAGLRRASLATDDGAVFRNAITTLATTERSEEGKAISRVDLQILSMKSLDPEFSSLFEALHGNDDFSDAVAQLAEQGELAPGVDQAVAAATLESLLMGFKMLSLMGEKHGDLYAQVIAFTLDRILVPGRS